MTPFFEKMFRAGGTITTVLTRFRKRAGLTLLSKHENALRASVSLATRDRKAKEAERLDRLRNPRNYEGR